MRHEQIGEFITSVIRLGKTMGLSDEELRAGMVAGVAMMQLRKEHPELTADAVSEIIATVAEHEIITPTSVVSVTEVDSEAAQRWLN
jgi:hypothetical protein